MSAQVAASAAKLGILQMRIPASSGVPLHALSEADGNGFLGPTVVGIPKSAVSIQGQLKTFHDTGDSGQPVERNFCPECGSPIFTDLAVMPGLTFIKAGTLDDTSWLDPKVHIFCDRAERWTPIPEGSRKFGKMPA